MKVFVILLVMSVIVVSSTTNAFAQSQTKCHFGDSDTPDSEIFAQDVAVKTFVAKYPDSNRTNTIHSSDPFDATLIYKVETEDEKITLTIDYRQNENGCYRPKNYQYSYNDGTIDVTVRNTLGSFTEIINLIKSDNKTLRDFYPDDCSFVDLEYSLSNGTVYGICKATDHPTITIQAKAYSDDTLEVNIPIEMVYSLPSSDCIPSNDFFVFTASGEKPYDIAPTDIGNLVTVELEQGANRITIAGSWIIPDPTPAQYCGIVDGYDKKYLPPLAQLDHEMKPSQIRCNDSLVLVYKNDGSPACVTEQTKTKLIERGWTKTIHANMNHQSETTYSGPTDIPSANNQFAINFYSQVSQENTDNVFFSPASIFTAFAIAYEGAEGNTAKEMKDVFGFEPDDSERHERFADMQQRLNFEGQNNTLSIANALWLAKNFEAYDDYVNSIENYYSGTVESVDFASKEKSLDIINQWVHDNTNGKIEKIFETLRPDTKLAITNAIYFKGIWEEPFDKVKTTMAPFHVRDGVTVSVPMMELDDVYLNQTKTPTARILELPYEGSKLSMLILLPNETGEIRALEDSLSTENISAWQEDYAEIKTRAYVPKFKLETDYDLIPLLTDLGVRDAFGNADFSGISDLDLFIYKAVHKAFVEVNEEGTEAAAATGMAMMESGPAEFRADRPFVFIIQDNETGQILFMGRVMDPTQ